MRLVWRRAALDDLARLADFIPELYPSRSAELAQRFAEATSPLRQMPFMGRLHPSRTRVRELIVRIGSAAYVAQYLVEEAQGDVVILRVFHGREARP